MEEVDQSPAPDGGLAHLLTRVHEHLVNEDEDGQSLLLREAQQLQQQVFSGGGFALGGFALGVEQAQAGIPGKLVSQHAPGLLEPARGPIRPPDFHALFDVEFVEGQQSHTSLGRGHADVLDEFLDRRQIGQMSGIVG